MAEYGPPTMSNESVLIGARNESNNPQKRAQSKFKNKKRRYQSPKEKKKKIIKCGICNVNEWKYKCPNCRVMKYCSVACYQKHKEDTDKCIKPKKRLKFDKNEPISVSGYTVTQKQFKLLENDDDLKMKLMNKKWRKIIERIDDAKKPQNKLEDAMKNDPEFAKFVDYIMKVIGFRPNEDKEIKNGYLQLDNLYDEEYDFDTMNDEEKFKYLLRKMLKENNA